MLRPFSFSHASSAGIGGHNRCACCLNDLSDKRERIAIVVDSEDTHTKERRHDNRHGCGRRGGRLRFVALIFAPGVS